MRRRQCGPLAVVLVFLAVLGIGWGAQQQSWSGRIDLGMPAGMTLWGQISAIGASDLAVDIGAARPVSVRLAGISVADCGVPQPRQALLIAQILRIGDPVVVVRTTATTSVGETVRGYVYRARARFDPRTMPSLNEELVASGMFGVGDGGINSALPRTLAARIAQRLRAAESQARAGHRGVVGACLQQPAAALAISAHSGTPVQLRRGRTSPAPTLTRASLAAGGDEGSVSIPAAALPGVRSARAIEVTTSARKGDPWTAHMTIRPRRCERLFDRGLGSARC